MAADRDDEEIGEYLLFDLPPRSGRRTGQQSRALQLARVVRTAAPRIPAEIASPRSDTERGEDAAATRHDEKLHALRAQLRDFRLEVEMRSDEASTEALETAYGRFAGFVDAFGEISSEQREQIVERKTLTGGADS